MAGGVGVVVHFGLDDGDGGGLDGLEVLDGRLGRLDQAVADGVLQLLHLRRDLVQEPGDVGRLRLDRVDHPLNGLLALGRVGRHRVDYERFHVGGEGNAPDCHQGLLPEQGLVLGALRVGVVTHVLLHGHERAEGQVDRLHGHEPLRGVHDGHLVGVCLLVAADEPLDPGGQLPVGGDDPGRVETAVRVHVTVQYVRPHHVRVVGVGVLSEL